jgi:hypothetical protein
MKRRLLLASLAVAVFCPSPAEAASRTQPQPRAACVEREGSTPVAVFDVVSSRVARVPVGRRNRVSGGRVVGAQPTSFTRGTRSGALRVRFTSARVSWRLGTQVARLARTGTQCESAAASRKPAAARQPAKAAPKPAATAPKTTPSTPTPTPAVPTTSLLAAAFSPTSFWNATIPANVAFAGGAVATGTAADGSTISKPVNPTVGQELAAFSKRSDGSSNTWINYRDFTAPITVVPASTRLQPIRLCRFYPSDCVPPWAWSLDLTLRGVAADGTYLGGGVPVPDRFTPPTDSDAEAIIYQPDYVAPDGKRGRVYELYGMRANPDFNPSRPISPTNARWMAKWGGRLVGTTGQGSGYWTDCWWSGCGYQADTRADPQAWGRPDSQARNKSWGATATSLSLLGTTVSLRECRAGVIDHAIGIQVPDAHPGAWWPAQRGDGGKPSLVVTEGMRLTFPRGTTKPAGLSTVASSLWDAASKYGLIIDDKTSSSLNFRVEPGCERTAWWGSTPTYNQMRNFPWQQLRVIAVGSDAQPNPTA